MYTIQWRPVAVGLVAGLILYAGFRHGMAGTGGTMQCGMDMAFGNPRSPASSSRTLKITATMRSPAQVGDNALDIVITNVAGKPLTAAKVTTEVAMTSMDMGTSNPPVKEAGKGHYATTVAFSMAGPWRVTVKVVAPGQKLQSRSFDFLVS